MRVLILSATAGQGHHATSQAIAVPLQKRGDTVAILDVFAYISPILKDFIEKGYLLSTKVTPKGYGSVYARLDKNHTPAGKYSFRSTTNRFLMRELEDYVRNFRADVIIAVHPFNATILSNMVASGLTKALTIGVITDFTVHPFWQDTALLDAYVTADELLNYQMRAKGLSEEKILPYGIPIQPKFLNKGDKKEARKALALAPDKKTLLIMSGSMGYGRMDESIRELDGLPIDFQAMVVCGNNKNMEHRIRLMHLKERTRIFGYVQNVDEMMTAADCIITKPGGLTVSEALAKQLPLILTHPIPGQESRNAEFLVNNQLAMLVTPTYSLREAVYTLCSRPELLERLRRNETEFFKGNSAARLVAYMDEAVRKKKAEGKQRIK